MLATHLEQRADQVAVLPQLAEARRQHRVRRVGEALHEPLRVLAERELHASCGAKQVGHGRPRRALHVREEQRGSAGGDHAAMDFCRFQIRVDLGVDDAQFALAA